jgi:hypothetical protein
MYRSLSFVDPMSTNGNYIKAPAHFVLFADILLSANSVMNLISETAPIIAQNRERKTEITTEGAMLERLLSSNQDDSQFQNDVIVSNWTQRYLFTTTTNFQPNAFQIKRIPFLHLQNLLPILKVRPI